MPIRANTESYLHYRSGRCDAASKAHRKAGYPVMVPRKGRVLWDTLAIQDLGEPTLTDQLCKEADKFLQERLLVNSIYMRNPKPHYEGAADQAVSEHGHIYYPPLRASKSSPNRKTLFTSSGNSRMGVVYKRGYKRSNPVPHGYVCPPFKG
jgi:hypothetical protein